MKCKSVYRRKEIEMYCICLNLDFCVCIFYKFVLIIYLYFINVKSKKELYCIVVIFFDV